LAQRTQGYETQTDAARAALYEANPRSIEEGIEYYGVIYEKNGRFFYTTPRPGEVATGNIEESLSLVPDSAVVVGDYHTHGDYGVVIGDALIRSPFGSDTLGQKGVDFWSLDDMVMAGIRARVLSGGQTPVDGYRSYLGTPSGKFYRWDFRAYNSMNPVRDHFAGGIPYQLGQ
jgi:hypothetical protein